MHTRSSSNLPIESPPNPSTSNPKRRNRIRSKQPLILKESLVDTMADQRTTAELLRAPTEGYVEAIVVPLILAEQFELKNRLINMMTSDWGCPTVAQKRTPRSILTWEDLVSKFINEFFPSSRTSNLHNEISNFQQQLDESFHETWDRYKDLLRVCPHHGFTEMHQLDTFYNALNPTDQDSLNSAMGGKVLERRTQDVLTIIENKSKVCNSRNKLVVSQVKSSDANSSSSKIAKLTHAVNQQKSAVTTAITAILKQFQATPPPASVKVVEEICVTCGGAHLYYQFVPLSELEKIKRVNEANMKAMQTHINNVKNELRNEMKNLIQASMSNQTNELKNMMASFFQMNTASTSGSGHISSNTIANPKGELKSITTRSGIILDGPSVLIPPPFINLEVDERVDETLMDQDLVEYTIKFTFLSDFVIVDYESDPRVPLIFVRPFLRTARALIDVHEEEMILRYGDERLTLNMRHDTSSYSNQPQKESINMINIFNDSSEDFLENLFSKNHQSGNPTFSSHLDGSTTSSSSPNHLLEDFADELALITFPLGNDDLPFDIKSDPKEIEYMLHHDPIKDIDSILKDSIDQINLVDLNDNLVNTMPEMFTEENALDYSSHPLYDQHDDDFFEVESDTEYVYDDPFDSKVDALPSTNNEDKVFNPSILIQENPFKVITHIALDKKQPYLMLL
nr:hypothetical protein [Tanacetum cinerariifolium]